MNVVQDIRVGRVWIRKADGVPHVVKDVGTDESGPQVCVAPTARTDKSFWFDEVDFRNRFRPEGAEPAPAAPPALAEFRVGDAVRLAGGWSKDDPTMTVTKVDRKFLTADGDDTPYKDLRVMDAVWVAYVPRYGESGAISRDRFPAAALRAVVREPVAEEPG